jgi:hypothetical protein
MVADSLIAACVKSETKERFADFARRQGLSESAMLKRLVDAALMAAAVMQPQVSEPVEPVAQGGKISVRLRSDDLLPLRERANGRSLPAST